MEAAAWTGYFVKHDDGMEMRTQYEAFADAHWDYDKWIDDHPCPTVPPTGATLEDVEDCGEASSGSGAWPGYIPWVSKEEDKQHYYENIGKYDWYISGWQDWDPTQSPYAQQTDLRTEYRGMREQSNNDRSTTPILFCGCRWRRGRSRSWRRPSSSTLAARKPAPEASRRRCRCGRGRADTTAAK